MTARVRILPDAIAIRIAAGEVVERPASVVKELMENSLDAGSSNIIVEAYGSGRKLIKVEDDGQGMPPDDLLLSLERHATSKISSLRDLYSVRTLGFRGEALPSIASVSRMSIASSRGNGAPGRVVRIEGGVIRKVEDAALPRGTTVEVRSLFYNTPARLKFMKSEATERGWITTMFQQQALAHPQVSFHLRMGEKETLTAPSTASVRDRVASLFGPELAGSLVEIEHAVGRIKLTGFISQPALTRSGRDMQFAFVNGRCVRETVVMSAIAHGYRTLLPRGRYPVVFLYLELDPSQVDVNVHPAKLEVKFQNAQLVYDAVVEAIGQALFEEQQPTSQPSSATYERREAAPPEPEPAGPPSSDGRRVGLPGGWESSKALVPERQMRLPVSSELSPLGQLDNAFIVAGSREGIIIIDQHTAHEKILYERILRQFREVRVESQHLLIPQPVNLTPPEMALMEERKEGLERLGFSADLFGRGTALLRSVPALLPVKDYGQVFQEVTAHLSEVGRLKPFEELLEELAAIMACRGAIKAGEPLDDSKIEGLLRDLELLEKPASCPHGRPIYLLLGIEEIKKRFMRN